MVQQLVGELDTVPLLPSSLKQHACSMAVELVCDALEDAMTSAYADTLEAIDAALDEAERHAAELRRLKLAGGAAAEDVAAARQRCTACQVQATEAAATPFNHVVRAELVASLQTRLRVPDALRKTVERHVGRRICAMLSSTFNIGQMNAAATYVYDQHILDRRLHHAPPSARNLMLRKKEEILAELVSMHAARDGGALTARELARGLRWLDANATRRDADALFAALDLDGDGTLTMGELELGILGRELSLKERQLLLKRTAAPARSWFAFLPW